MGPGEKPRFGGTLLGCPFDHSNPGSEELAASWAFADLPPAKLGLQTLLLGVVG